MPKDTRLDSTHYFIMKIPNKREPQQIAINYLSDIDFKDFVKIYKKCKYSFLVDNTILHHKVLYILDKIFQKVYKK